MWANVPICHSMTQQCTLVLLCKICCGIRILFTIFDIPDPRKKNNATLRMPSGTLWVEPRALDCQAVRPPDHRALVTHLQPPWRPCWGGRWAAAAWGSWGSPWGRLWSRWCPPPYWGPVGSCLSAASPSAPSPGGRSRRDGTGPPAHRGGTRTLKGWMILMLLH